MAMKKYMMEEMNEPEHKNSLGKMKKVSASKSSGKKRFGKSPANTFKDYGSSKSGGK